MPVTINGTTGVTTPATILSGSSSGSTTLQATAVASGTSTIPASTGTVIETVTNMAANPVTGTPSSSNYLRGDGTWAAVPGITTGTAVTPTSGTTATLATGLPSTIKRITINFYSVQMTTATSSILVQLGTSGGFVTTGYVSSSSYTTSGPSTGFSNTTNGMVFGTMTNNAQILYGSFVLTTIGGNNWVGIGNNSITTNALICTNTGYLSLGGALTQLQMSTISGTGVFSTGTFNVLYE
jgi:hypothetical protein